MKDIVLEIGKVRKLPSFVQHLSRNKTELDRFFGIKLPVPQVFLIQSRYQIDKIWKRKTESGNVGWAKGGAIYILSPENYVRESDRKNMSTYWKVLKHEHAHIYQSYVAGGWLPRWLSEGLACWLAGQTKNKPDLQIALSVIQYHVQGGAGVYQAGYYWVERLIGKFGKKKLVAFLRALGPEASQHRVRRVFKNIYGVNWTKASLKKLYS